MGQYRDYANQYGQYLNELQTLSDKMDQTPHYYTRDYINSTKQKLNEAKSEYPRISRMADEEDQQIARIRQSLIPTDKRNPAVDRAAIRGMNPVRDATTNRIRKRVDGAMPEIDKWHSEFEAEQEAQRKREAFAQSIEPDRIPAPGTNVISESTGTPTGVPSTVAGKPAGFFDEPIDFAKKMGKEFSRGIDDHRLNKMWADVSRGQFDRAEAEKIDAEFQARAEADPVDADNWLSQALYSTARMVGQMGGTMLRSGGKASAVGLGVGAVASPAAGVIAGAATAPVFGFMDWHDQSAGAIYRSLVKDPNTPIDENIAAVVSNLVAIPYTAIEMSQLGKIVPGAEKLGAKAMQSIPEFRILDNVLKTASKSVVPKLLKRDLKNAGMTIGKEVLEEVEQGNIELITQEFAKTYNNLVKGTNYEVNLDDVSAMSKAIFETTKNTIKETALPLSLLTLPKAGLGISRNIKMGQALDKQNQQIKQEMDTQNQLEAMNRFKPAPIETNQPVPLGLNPEVKQTAPVVPTQEVPPVIPAAQAPANIQEVAPEVQPIPAEQIAPAIPAEQSPALPPEVTEEKPKRPAIPKQKREKVMEGISQGMPVTKIAKSAKVSVKAVQDIMNEINQQQVKNEVVATEPVNQTMPENAQISPPLNEGAETNIPPLEQVPPIMAGEAKQGGENIATPEMKPVPREPVSPKPQKGKPELQDTRPFAEKYGVKLEYHLAGDGKNRILNQEPAEYDDGRDLSSLKDAMGYEIIDELDRLKIKVDNIDNIDYKDKGNIYAPPKKTGKSNISGVKSLEKITKNDAGYNGILYDNGKIVATDTHRMFVIPSEYDPKLEGKHLTPDYQKPGREQFPEYKRVMMDSRDKNSIITLKSINIQDLIDYFNGVNYYTKKLGIEKGIGGFEIEKDFNPIYNAEFMVDDLKILQGNGGTVVNMRISADKYSPGFLEMVDDKGNLALQIPLKNYDPSDPKDKSGIEGIASNKFKVEIAYDPRKSSEKSSDSEVFASKAKPSPTYSIDENGQMQLFPSTTHATRSTQREGRTSSIVQGTDKTVKITSKDLFEEVKKLFPDRPIKSRGTRKMGKHTLGQYERGTSHVRARALTDVQTITHELAHAEHYLKFAMDTWDDNPVFQNELSRLDSNDETNPKKKIREGFAEFVRRWTLDDQALDQIAPDFKAFFEGDFMDKFNNDGRWTKLKELVQQFRRQERDEYIKQQLEQDKYPEPEGFFKRFLRHPKDETVLAYAKLASKHHDTARLAEKMLQICLRKDYESLAYKDRFIEWVRMTSGRASEIARGMIQDTQVNPFTGKEIGPSLYKIYQNHCKTRQDVLDLDRYWKAKLLLEVYHNFREKGKYYELPGGTPKEFQGIIEEYEDKHPDWKDASKEIRKFQDNLIDFMFGVGGIDEDLAKNLKETYSFWVPLARVPMTDDPFYSKNVGTSKKFANQQQPFMKLKGGGEAPLSRLLDGYAKQVEKMVAFTAKARAMRALYDAYQMFPEAMSRIMQATNAPVASKQVKVEDLVNIISGLGITVDKDEIQNKDATLNLFFSEYLPKNSKDGLVMLYINGERKFFNLDKNLYDLVMGMDEGVSYGGLGTIMRWIAASSRAIRLGATTMKPEFILFTNFVSDMINRMTSSESLHSNPFQTFNGMIMEVIKNKKAGPFLKAIGIDPAMAIGYAASGGAFSTPLGVDQKALNNLQEKLEAKVEGKRITLGVKHPVESMRVLFSFMENANRIADYKEVYNKVYKETGDAEEAFIRAARSAQDVTVDFMRHGSYTKFASVIKPFHNAAVQGLSRASRNFTDKQIVKYRTDESGRLRAEKSVSRSLVTLPKMITWYVGMNILQRLLMPEEKKKEFDELPAYSKHGMWHFYVGDHEIVIPCKFITGAVFNGLLGTIGLGPMQGGEWDSEEKREWLKYTWNDSFAPLFPLPNFSTFISGISFFGALNDISRNKDVFGMPIEGRYARDTNPSALTITNKKTFEASKKLTQYIHKFGDLFPAFAGLKEISPIQLQYFIGKNTGGAYWRIGQNVRFFRALSNGEPFKDSDIPIGGVMFGKTSKAMLKPVRDFYDEINKAKSDPNYPYRRILMRTQTKINDIEGVLKRQIKRDGQINPQTKKNLIGVYDLNGRYETDDEFMNAVRYRLIELNYEQIKKSGGK